MKENQNVIVTKSGLSTVAKIAIGAITVIVISIGIIFGLHKKGDED